MGNCKRRAAVHANTDRSKARQELGDRIRQFGGLFDAGDVTAAGNDTVAAVGNHRRHFGHQLGRNGEIVIAGDAEDRDLDAAGRRPEIGGADGGVGFAIGFRRLPEQHVARQSVGRVVHCAEARLEPSPEMTTLMSGMGLKIELRQVDQLLPYARNARTHSDEQVALIAGSIRTRP